MTKLALLFAFAALLCRLPAAPVTGVREGFDYLEGGALAGGATGIGWAGAWGEHGESGDAKSELIIGPGSFPVPPGAPAATGNHVDLNQLTGRRTILRRMSVSLGSQGGAEYTVSFVLDVGGGAGGGGVDYAGIELSHSAGGPVVFLGKPPGAGPANDGTIVIDVYGQGPVSTGVPADGQKHLQLRWVEASGGPESLTLTVFSTAGVQLGSATAMAEATFNQVNLVARRDLAFGAMIPAFDEFTATIDSAPARTLDIASSNPSSGVAIAATPNDLAGQGGGATPFARTYAYGASVTLTAPAAAAGNVFAKWLRDGADISVNPSVVVTMNADRTMTAVYVAARTLTVDAAPVAGVTIAASPQDRHGLGTGATAFTRSYLHNTLVTLTAPATFGERLFKRWLRDGTAYSTNRVANIALDSDRTMTAVFDFPIDEHITALTGEGDDIRITWSSVGGRTYVVQATSNLLAGFTDISGPIFVSGIDRTTSSFLETGVADSPTRFYRLHITAP